jgi:hypothetical protein
MRRAVLWMGLMLVWPWCGWSDEVGTYAELAGTVVQSESRWTFRSNGQVYQLLLEPTDPGVGQLQSGLAIIVKGTVVTEDGSETQRTLRPSVLIIRGRTFQIP